MGKASFILLSLTAIVAAMAAALAFVILRLFAAARELNRTKQGAGAEQGAKQDPAAVRETRDDRRRAHG